MQPLDGERNAMAIFNARVTKSRFIRLLTAQPMTQALCRKLLSVFFHKPEPHGFWLVKNTVAFIGETLHWGLS